MAEMSIVAKWEPLILRLISVMADELDFDALISLLGEAAGAGASRREMYDALEEALRRHRAEVAVMPPHREEVVEDILDRLWGHCVKERVLFPHLPPPKR